MSIEQQLIKSISDVAWDTDNLSLVQIVTKIQGYLYEYEAICDHATEEQERHWAEYANSMK